MSSCPFCGKSIDNDSAFCKYCGTKIPIYSVDFIYTIRQWTIYKETGKPEDKSQNSWVYYGFHEDACEAFFNEFRLHQRVAKDHPEFTIGPLHYLEETKGDCFWKRTNPINCIDSESVIEFYDYYHSFNGKLWHSVYDLAVSKLQSPITMKKSERESKYVYVYEEYIVLDDSRDNHRGFSYAEEYYGNEKDAMKRIEREMAKYAPDRIEIRDWRKSFWSNFEKYGPNGWYGFDVRDSSNHLCRTAYISISIIR